MPKKLDPEAKRAEHAALVRGLRRFAEQQGRPAVFPDLAGTTGLVMYGKYTEPGTLSHQVIEMVAAEINGCAHIRSASNPTSVWEPKPLESVRANYISKIGKEEGQEDAEAFEAFEREELRIAGTGADEVTNSFGHVRTMLPCRRARRKSF